MEPQRHNPTAASSKGKLAQTAPKQHKNFPEWRSRGKPMWLEQGTGAEIISIGSSQLQPDLTPVESNSGFEMLCSYNWQNNHVPAIYVPGAPPNWKPHDLPVTLQPDKGGRYIDQNAHKVPEYPFEPMFRAMSIMKPDFNFSNVDFVTNRNSLRRLLDFTTGKVRDPFRIDLDMVKETLVLTRREQRTREKTGTHMTNLGYGSNFEHYFTSAQKELEDSSSHHRVTRYKFGDLDCVVRYEVDACMQEDSTVVDEHNEAKPATTKAQQGPEDLLDSLKDLSLTTQNDKIEKAKPKKGKQGGFGNVKIVERGYAVDSAQLVELKSKSKPPRIRDLVPQLWFGRIPYLVVGIHEKGTFNNISITETAVEFQKFEEYSQDGLRKVVHLIKVLRDTTAKSKDKSCVVVCDPKVKPLKLSVYSSTIKKHVLPDEVIGDYWRETEA